MKLLVPVDDSRESMNAVIKSVELAKEHDYSIKFVTIIEPSDIASKKRNSRLWSLMNGSIISGKEESQMSLEAKAALLLHEITASLNITGIKTEKEILVGKKSKKIWEMAENEKFDMVIVGNKDMLNYKRPKLRYCLANLLF